MDTEIFEITSVRVRVALVLAIAEYAMELLPLKEGVGLAREGLDASWEWERGGNISAKALQEYVEGGGGGLLCLASTAIAKKTPEEPVLQVAATCIAYTAREACLQIGENLSETIELATSEAVEHIIEMYLVQMPGFNQQFLDRIADYLLAHYKTDRPEELGPVLDRNVVLSVGHGKR